MTLDSVRTGTLIENKYLEYFFSALITGGSFSIAYIVDRIMIGNLLSTKALAAATLTTPVIYVVNIIFVFFIYGGNTVAMTYKGRCDGKTADKCFTISIILGSLIMLLFGIIGFLYRDFLTGSDGIWDHECRMGNKYRIFCRTAALNSLFLL